MYSSIGLPASLSERYVERVTRYSVSEVFSKIGVAILSTFMDIAIFRHVGLISPCGHPLRPHCSKMSCHPSLPKKIKEWIIVLRAHGGMKQIAVNHRVAGNFLAVTEAGNPHPCEIDDSLLSESPNGLVNRCRGRRPIQQSLVKISGYSIARPSHVDA